MVDQADVELGFVTHCKLASWADQVIWPNSEDGLDRPKIAFDLVRVSTTDRTIDGSKPIHRGYLMLTVIHELGRFTTPANRLADQIAAHFPYPGLRISVTGGRIAVIKPPEVLRGFRDRDAGEWRVPVRIDYQAQ